MSSVGDGLCNPTHVNVEVWTATFLVELQKYAAESYTAGAVGYVGLSGLFTTTEFVQQGANATRPFAAEFWRDYVTSDALINATRVSTLKNNTKYYPPTENGCANGFRGCQDACSRSSACTEREHRGGECMVVIMMYAEYDPGYLQATMSNLGIPAYFCFLGLDGAQEYVDEAQRNGQPVVFYHYEPDLFHLLHPGLFTRVFLPRAKPEKVLESTGTFGENGYGNATDNPVAVDFPTNILAKYVSSRIEDLPIASFLSKFIISKIDLNNLLASYLVTSSDPTDDDPFFTAACSWVRSNYQKWQYWVDRLPLCTYESHMTATISGCNDSANPRVITFAWIMPNPTNDSLPYACDGGYTELPPPMVTSRSCEWLELYKRTWNDWIDSKPRCDATFYDYSTSTCNSEATRTVTYGWLLPSPTDNAKSLECQNGVTLPNDVSIACEYMPLSSLTVAVVAVFAGVVALLLIAALLFVRRNRAAPIIKRSQPELLELVIVGGFFTIGAAVAYAGRPTHLLCGVRPVLISFGFTTIFGSLVAKSLRVYRVFMQKAMKRTTVPLRASIKVLMIFYLTDVLIFVAWFAADFPSPTTLTELAEEYPVLVDRVACRSTSFIFSALLMFWKAILLFAGLYLSFLIRNVSTDFQESIWIFSSAVVVLLACLVIMPLAYLVDLSAPAFYVFLAGTLILCTAIVVGLMIGPKLQRLKESDTSIESGSSNRSAHRKSANQSFVSMGKRASLVGPSRKLSAGIQQIKPTKNQ